MLFNWLGITTFFLGLGANEPKKERSNFMIKKPYVLVLDCGVLKCWPYPEVQEFCQFDLSKEVIYLTDYEVKKIFEDVEE